MDSTDASSSEEEDSNDSCSTTSVAPAPAPPAAALSRMLRRGDNSNLADGHVGLMGDTDDEEEDDEARSLQEGYDDSDDGPLSMDVPSPPAVDRGLRGPASFPFPAAAAAVAFTATSSAAPPPPPDSAAVQTLRIFKDAKRPGIFLPPSMPRVSSAETIAGIRIPWAPRGTPLFVRQQHHRARGVGPGSGCRTRVRLGGLGEAPALLGVPCTGSVAAAARAEQRCLRTHASGA